MACHPVGHYLSDGVRSRTRLDKSNTLTGYLSDSVRSRTRLDKSNPLSGHLSDGVRDHTRLEKSSPLFGYLSNDIRSRTRLDKNSLSGHLSEVNSPPVRQIWIRQFWASQMAVKTIHEIDRFRVSTRLLSARSGTGHFERPGCFRLIQFQAWPGHASQAG